MATATLTRAVRVLLEDVKGFDIEFSGACNSDDSDLHLN